MPLYVSLRELIRVCSLIVFVCVLDEMPHIFFHTYKTSVHVNSSGGNLAVLVEGSVIWSNRLRILFLPFPRFLLDLGSLFPTLPQNNMNFQVRFRHIPAGQGARLSFPVVSICLVGYGFNRRT